LVRDPASARLRRDKQGAAKVVGVRIATNVAWRAVKNRIRR